MINGGVTPERLCAAKVILWKGHCSVHQRFLPEHVDNARSKYPGIRVIAHPECRWEVCQKADGIGSTEGLLKMIKQAPSGTMFAVGTEIHLVNRMGKEFAAEGKKVITLDDSAASVPPCSGSRSSICAGRWRIWWKATSSTDQSRRRSEALGKSSAGQDAGNFLVVGRSSLAIGQNRNWQFIVGSQPVTGGDSRPRLSG